MEITMKSFYNRIIASAVALFVGAALMTNVATAAPNIIIKSASWYTLCHKIKVTVDPTTASFYGVNGVKLYWRKQTPQGSWNATGIAGTLSNINNQTYIYDISSVPANQFPIEIILGTSATNTGGNIGSSSNIKVIGPCIAISGGEVKSRN